jgi:hypothetical protein
MVVDVGLPKYLCEPAVRDVMDTKSGERSARKADPMSFD